MEIFARNCTKFEIRYTQKSSFPVHCPLSTIPCSLSLVHCPLTISDKFTSFAPSAMMTTLSPGWILSLPPGITVLLSRMMPATRMFGFIFISFKGMPQYLNSGSTINSRASALPSWI